MFVSLAAATAVFYVNDNNLQLKKRVDSLEGRGFDKAIIANCQAVSIKCDPKFIKVNYFSVTSKLLAEKMALLSGQFHNFLA